MKSNKIYLILGLVVTMTSCKKLIEIRETDVLSGNAALTNVTYVEQAIIGAYSPLAPDMNILLNSTFTDEVTKADFYNAGSTHEWQYGPGDVTLRDNLTALYPLYTTINRVNIALAALPLADSTKVGDNVKKENLRGEGLFLRAYAHFELFRWYCGNYDPAGLGMAYMENSTLTPSPRILMGPYFVKLLADLNTAKTFVPKNLNDISRANLAAVAGLQARVALYMREWADAEKYATEFISLLPLATRGNFPGIWTDVNTFEQALRYVKTNTIGTRIGSLFRGTSASATSIGVGLVTWKPSEELWSSYDKVNDIRFNSYFLDEPLLNVSSRSSTRLISKYAGSTYATSNENVANGKLLRTGEMYLIRAEARAEQGKLTGTTGADNDINTLRENRVANVTPVVYATKQQAIDDIMQERFKELAYEGHRFFDLKRRGLPITRIAADAASTAGLLLPANNFRFVIPIPLPEITANPSFVQNPGYF